MAKYGISPFDNDSATFAHNCIYSRALKTISKQMEELALTNLLEEEMLGHMFILAIDLARFHTEQHKFTQEMNDEWQELLRNYVDGHTIHSETLAKTLDVYFVKKADNDAKNGDYSKIGFYHYSSLVLITLFKIVPIFLAIMLGGEYVADLFAKVPPIVMQGLNSAGALLPSIGFGMLLNMMLKKNMWVFLLIGFICSVYGGMSTIGISLVGIAVAYFYDMIGSKPQETTSNSDVEEDLDL